MSPIFITDLLAIPQGSLHRSFTGNVLPSYEGPEGPQMINHSSSFPSSNILPSHSLTGRPIGSIGMPPPSAYPRLQRVVRNTLRVPRSYSLPLLSGGERTDPLAQSRSC